MRCRRCQASEADRDAGPTSCTPTRPTTSRVAQSICGAGASNVASRTQRHRAQRPPRPLPLGRRTHPRLACLLRQAAHSLRAQHQHSPGFALLGMLRHLRPIIASVLLAALNSLQALERFHWAGIFREIFFQQRCGLLSINQAWSASLRHRLHKSSC